MAINILLEIYIEDRAIIVVNIRVLSFVKVKPTNIYMETVI